jgi:hypothetical protein
MSDLLLKEDGEKILKEDDSKLLKEGEASSAPKQTLFRK